MNGPALSADSLDCISTTGEFGELLDNLMAIDVAAKRTTKAGKKRLAFELEEAKFVVKTMTQEIGAEEGITRLNKLIEDYKGCMPGLADTGAATRAEELAQSDSIPAQARPFFQAFSRLEKTMRDEGSTLRSFRSMMEKVNFVNSYHMLVLAIDDNIREEGVFDESLSRTFRDLGLKGKWSTIARDYLAMKCNVDRSVVADMITESSGIHQMVQYFGTGILCLVPETMAKRYVTVQLILGFPN